MAEETNRSTVTFIEQNAPVDEYGRALYAVSRSILRAYIDSITNEDLADINTPLDRVRMRQFAKIARLERDKGMRGDGFEWAVHEAIIGGEPKVTSYVSQAMRMASKFVPDNAPTSILFGQERAKFLGFLDAVVDKAGTDSFLLPQGSGKPFKFGPWVSLAAQGHTVEDRLNNRIKKIWKTDLFLAASGDVRHFAATIKSNIAQLEGGAGLRIGIVPESSSVKNGGGVRYDADKKLWIVSLDDPNGFMGIYNDAYHAVARAICTLGKHHPPPYYVKPSAKGQRVQEQIEKYPDALVLDVEDALNEASQQNLVKESHVLMGVNAPNWLHVKQKAISVISPKPKFIKLD
ncbi:hypothetical protein [Bradyrhizobium sp. SZCCHNRI1009]|uniref:hypothetical protein n=1 Tax=Bradyrhizobium TaxID=374 RepID=UPI0029167E8E|nr:hypothetical protein [Bradyrhizobium sp. SZCCHNRI1009]